MPAHDHARDQRTATVPDVAGLLPPARRSLAQRIAASVSAHRRIGERIDLAAGYAAQAMIEQPSLLRQTLARSWALRARVLRLSLDATRSMQRDAVDRTRTEVAVAADRLVAEIIASMEGWVRSDQDVTRLRRELAATQAPSERLVVPSMVLTDPPAPVVVPHASPRPPHPSGAPSGGPRRLAHPSPRPHEQQAADRLPG